MLDFPNAPTTGQGFQGYTWDGGKWTVSGTGGYLPTSGGTLTGPLILAADPTVPLGASTKQYVDNNLSFGSITLPVIDGTATIGVSTRWAHADHVHPTDTSRYAATNPSGYQTAAQVTAVVPVAASTTPVMNGTAAVGVGTTWARADHVHASDTSRLATATAATTYLQLSGGTLTGALTLSGNGVSALHAATVQQLPTGSVSLPVMDGTAAIGVATTWAHADHVHASDSTRLGTTNNLSELTATASTARGNLGLTAIATLATAAQGSIVYMGASGPATIAPGTAGYTFQTNGPGANPTWVPSVAGAPLGSASPLMNGTATAGVAAFTSHEDHIHPVDTSRAPLVNTSLTGVTTTQALSVGSNSTANPSFTINGTASTRQITFQSVGLTRWRLTTNNTAEGGSDAGSDFNIIRYSDGGASLGIALGITRSSGNVTVGTTLTVTSTIAAAGINSTGAINTTGGANIVSNGSLTAQSNILSAAAVFGTTGCFADGTTNFGLFTSGNKRCLLYSGASGYQDTLDTTTGIREWISFDGIGVQMRLAFSGDLTILGSTATKTGGGSWSAPSDARIKDVLDSYDAGLDAICKLHPVRYRYKHNTDEPGVEQHRVNTDLYYIGLIAQEAEVAMPELVTETGGWIDGVLVDDLRVLDPSAITFALINAVRELSARVVALEGAAHATSA